MAIVIEGGISIGPGIDIGAGAAIPTLMLSLDAAGYTSGPWVDTVSGRSFTLNGGVTYDSGDGGSLVFDPVSSQYAECSSSLPNLNTWTVEVWHYYAGTNSAGAPQIVTETYLGGTEINYTLGAIDNSTTGILAGWWDGSQWLTTPSGYSLTAGNWYQVVGTYDGSTVKLYVNNALVEQASVTGVPTSTNQGIRLMSRWDNNEYWGGKLGIVKIYDGDIGASGVTTSWNANKSRFGLTDNSFTITSADILGSGGAIYQNITPLGTNGVDGFQNTGAQNWLYEGYYAQNLSSTLVTAITNYVTAQGINPNNSQGYVYNVTWGAGSSISSGLAKLGFYSGNGDPTSAYVDIQTIDPTDTDYQQNNNNAGTSLAGTFLFPATFTIYSPLTDKNGWC